MVTAICFLQIDVDKINQAGSAISNLPGVTAVYSVTGSIDLITVLEVRSHEDVAKVVTDGIAKVPGVQSTETHIAFRTYRNGDIEAAFSIGLD
ncbi:MAG: Lrp/AsnC family transcriptional regulator [Candidatus Nanopelagicales bacterium]